MRRCQPISFGDLWDHYIEENPQVENRLREGRIPEVWRKVAGDDIAALTTSIAFRNGNLTVSISSSAVRHEIFIRRTSFAKAMNDELGRQMIKNLIIR